MTTIKPDKKPLINYFYIFLLAVGNLTADTYIIYVGLFKKQEPKNISIHEYTQKRRS